MSETNIVKAHIEFFSDGKGNVTNESMTLGHTCQRITKGIGLKCRAINNMLSERELKKTVEDVGKMVNPARTGIWNTDGTFNETAFNEITSNAISHNGKKIMTKKIVMDHLKIKHFGKYTGKAC